LSAEKIEQCGEPIASVRTPFAVLKEFQKLRDTGREGRTAQIETN
jgi:hypothetical protein